MGYLSRWRLLFAIVPPVLFAASVAIGVWWFSREDGLSAKQRRRAAQVAAMRRQGGRFPWNWPAMFLMGLYALAKRMWWGAARGLWNSPVDRIGVPAACVLIGLAAASGEADAVQVAGSFVVLLALVGTSIACGASFNTWRYIFRGELPEKDFDPDLLPTDVPDADPYRYAPPGLLRFLPSSRFYLFAVLFFYLAFGLGGAYLGTTLLFRGRLRASDIATPSTYVLFEAAESTAYLADRDRRLAGVEILPTWEARRLRFRFDKEAARQQVGEHFRCVVRETPQGEVYIWQVSESGEIGMDVNAELIRQGLARARDGHPREQEFLRLEAVAREAGRGGWQP